jgi:hypothetical protein
MPEAYADAILSLVRYYQTGKASAVTDDIERVTGRKATGFDRFARDHADRFR